MIGVYFQGRLGNQLFQYAFAVSESKKINTGFFMDQSLERIIISKYFQLPGYHPLKSWFYCLLLGKKKPVIEIENAASYAENKKLLSQDHSVYKGYFQSALYFNSVYDELKKEFSLKPKHKVEVRKVLGITNTKPLIVLHVRRTDYLKHGDESMGGTDLSLPVSYYMDCLARINDLRQYNIIFVTDDQDFVRRHFAYLNPVISSNKNPIVDFQILLEADVLVVANSSFSWWGAYLNSECKEIYAPKYWLGFLIKKEYPRDIIPETWKQIEVT